jgi:hypothetical protein
MYSVQIGRSITNRWLICDLQIRALKAATEQSLQKPILLTSWYTPQYRDDKGTVQIYLWWIEDKPTLKEVIVRNPENSKELRIHIPQSRLDDSGPVYGETDGVRYGWIDRIPLDFIGHDPTQVLEVSAPDQKEPALCFPADVLDDPKNPSTKPAK